MASSPQVTNSGQSIIELLIVMALMAILLPVLIGGMIMTREGKPQQLRQAQAAQRMREVAEALRSIRERNWESIAIAGVYHVTTDGVQWSIAPGALTSEGITTEVVVSDVYRDSTNTIVSTGGSIDPSTKKVDITLSWMLPFPTSTTSSLYLSRYLDNATYTQSTQTDFETGTHNFTIVTNDQGGEVSLGAGGGGNWCALELTIASLDLPKNGVANAFTVVEGKGFAGTGDNASGVSVAQVAITNTNPPVASVEYTIDGYKTNDVFGEEGYVYITTDDNNEEVVIINYLTNTKIGTFDAPGSDNGESIYISGNTGYMTAGNNFHIFDLSSRTGSRPRQGGVTLSGQGRAIHVLDGYAYVALSGNTSREVEIINVSNPSAPSVIGYVNLPTSNGEDVVVNETNTRAFVATRGSSSSPELFIINIESKTGSRPIIGTYDSSGMDPQGIVIVPGNKAIIVGLGAEEYQAVNILNESAPVRCGGIDVDAGINDVASILESDGDAYSYILTRDSTAELRIIAGGPGGQYSASGVYESATFDVGYSTAFNRFIPQQVLPPNTTLRYQISIVDPVAGSCSGANFTYVGPAGTEDSYYVGEDLIPFDDDSLGYENPGRCFRYRAYLETTDSASTPLFEEVVVNYSP